MELCLYFGRKDEGSCFYATTEPKDRCKDRAELIREYEIPNKFADEYPEHLKLVINGINDTLRTIRTKGEEGKKYAFLVLEARLNSWNILRKNDK